MSREIAERTDLLPFSCIGGRRGQGDEGLAQIPGGSFTSSFQSAKVPSTFFRLRFYKAREWLKKGGNDIITLSKKEENPMIRLEKAVIILDLIDKLSQKGSWCGETHIQKSLYFLQELTDVPLGFDFILYKHGPFSFDLRDELNAMRADYMLTYQVPVPPYSPGLLQTDSGKKIKNHFTGSVEKYSKQIEFIASNIGNSGVVELERLGTALLVTRQNNVSNKEERAKKINELKPHVSLEEAFLAVEKVDEMIGRFNSQFSH